MRDVYQNSYRAFEFESCMDAPCVIPAGSTQRGILDDMFDIPEPESSVFHREPADSIFVP